jgi:diguanylate cyclase (GGDEF)-like protein
MLPVVCRTATKSKSDTALLILDISEYHNINLKYGEETGNRVLQLVAAHLNQVCRESDYLARIGDDQFSCLLTGILGREHALLAAHKLQNIGGRPLVVNGNEILLRLNLGISLLSQAAEDPNQLFTGALKALYRSKNGFDQVTMDDGNNEAFGKKDGDLLLDYSRAFSNGDLELKYQAKQELNNDMICGAEALLRWQHPERGNIQPKLIVELAQKVGRMDSLTSWILNQALRGCSRWLRLGIPMTVSVNLEAGTFNNALLPEQIEEALRLWQVEPRFLIVEITESALMEQNSQVSLNIEKINRIGARISIDDFGTGYSSLAYLNRLDVHELKIDKCFIDEMGSSAKDETLVRAVINLGQNIGLKVTAEGVENYQQYQKLRMMGCDIIQGYHVSKPITIDEFIDFVSERLR